MPHCAAWQQTCCSKIEQSLLSLPLLRFFIGSAVQKCNRELRPKFNRKPKPALLLPAGKANPARPPPCAGFAHYRSLFQLPQRFDCRIIGRAEPRELLSRASIALPRYDNRPTRSSSFCCHLFCRASAQIADHCFQMHAHCLVRRTPVSRQQGINDCSMFR